MSGEYYRFFDRASDCNCHSILRSRIFCDRSGITFCHNSHYILSYPIGVTMHVVSLGDSTYLSFNFLCNFITCKRNIWHHKCAKPNLIHKFCIDLIERFSDNAMSVIMVSSMWSKSSALSCVLVSGEWYSPRSYIRWCSRVELIG